MTRLPVSLSTYNHAAFATKATSTECVAAVAMSIVTDRNSIFSVPTPSQFSLHNNLYTSANYVATISDGFGI
jgi:hypothetical protein